MSTAIRDHRGWIISRDDKTTTRLWFSHPDTYFFLLLVNILGDPYWRILHDIQYTGLALYMLALLSAGVPDWSIRGVRVRDLQLISYSFALIKSKCYSKVTKSDF